MKRAPKKTVPLVVVMLWLVLPLQHSLAATNTSEIASAATAGAPDCVDFCWIGICVSIVCTPLGCTLDYSAWVSHHSPDYVVSSYKEPGENTWSEMRSVLQSSAKSAANSIVGFDQVEATGGPNYVARQRREAERGAGQERSFSNLHFKEATVIGSPTVLATNAIPYTCPSTALPFLPYFQSEYDAFEWRWGLLEKLYPSSWIPGLREISQRPLTTWGGVHPRMGFVKSEHPARAAAVAAQRAIDIVTRIYQPHVYYPTFETFTSDEKEDHWQMVSPQMDSMCYAFGEPTDYVNGRVDDREEYSFLYWPKLECCPDAKGVVIAHIPTAEVCL